MTGDRRRATSEYRMIAAPGDTRSVLLPARLLANVEGFAMVRRPGATTTPFVVSHEEWASAPAREK